MFKKENFRRAFYLPFERETVAEVVATSLAQSLVDRYPYLKELATEHICQPDHDECASELELILDGLGILCPGET